MIRRLFFLVAFLTPLSAFGQGAVLQQGGALQGHLAQWLSNGYVADAGGPLANGLAPVNPISGLLPLGVGFVNSGLGICQFSGYASAAYSSLCTGFDGSGNGVISLSNTASSPTLSININGTSYPFPGTGTGNALMPTSPVIPSGDLVAANGGTNLKDGGSPNQFVQAAAIGQVSLIDYGTNTCTGSDDSTSLVTAAATGYSIMLPAAATCNFNTTQGSGPPYVVQLSGVGQGISGAGNKFATTISSSLSNSVLIKMMSNGQFVKNLTFTGMTDGFAIFSAGGTGQLVAQNYFHSIGGGILAMNGARDLHFQDNYCAGVTGGTPSLLNAASGSTKAAIFNFDNTNAPGLHVLNNTCTIGATGAYFVLMDGNTQTSDWLNTQVNTPLECLHVQDSGSVGEANFIYSFNFQCQTPTGTAGFDFAAPPAGGGVEYVMVGSFCNHSSNYCMYIGNGVARVEVTEANFNGCGLACIYADGQTQIFGPGVIGSAGANGNTACTLFANNLCPAIGIGPDSQGTLVIGVSTQASAIKQESWGVDVINGARQITLSGNNFDGNTLVGAWHNENPSGNSCGNTRTTEIVVIDDGRCVTEATVSNTSGTTIAAANMVNSVPGAMINLWRYGPTGGGGFTDTTDTAANLIAALPGTAYVGQTWLLNYVLATQVGGTATLAGGTGVTISGPNTINVGNSRVYLCTVTNLSAAVKCVGQ